MHQFKTKPATESQPLTSYMMIALRVETIQMMLHMEESTYGPCISVHEISLPGRTVHLVFLHLSHCTEHKEVGLHTSYSAALFRRRSVAPAKSDCRVWLLRTTSAFAASTCTIRAHSQQLL